MFLNYFALGVLIFVFLVLFYGIIAIHDIPYNMAKKRNHPHADAIHTAGWISLFTLHAIWPFLWIWATLYREDRGWGMQTTSPSLMRSGHGCAGQTRGRIRTKAGCGTAPQIRTRWSANHGSVDYFDLCGICLGHFKIFRIPVNQWTLATAALGGYLLLPAYSINEL
jgi:hypothetical protein